MKVLVTRRIPEIGIELLKKAGFQVTTIEQDLPIVPSELKKLVVGHDALLTQLVDHIDAEVMDAAGKQLKIIANYAVGFDNINLSDAARRQILVTNTPDATESVADHAFALMLAAARRVVEADKFSRKGKYTGWHAFLMLGQDVYQKTLGIIGAGRIGSALATRAASGFNMKILYTDQVAN